MGGTLVRGEPVRPRSAAVSEVVVPASPGLSTGVLPGSRAHATGALLAGHGGDRRGAVEVSPGRDGRLGGGTRDERVLVGQDMGHPVPPRDPPAGESGSNGRV